MVIFFVVVSLLVLLAIGFVVPVLLKDAELEAETFDEQNIQIARDRLKELKQEFDNGIITESDYDLAKQELENNLALDLSVSESASASAVSTGASKNLAFSLLIIIPVAAAVLYYQLGEFDAITGNVETVTDSMPQPPNMSMEEAITGLKARLKAEPDNPEGWFMLARTYAAIQQYDDAVSAYEKTLELVGENANLLLHYADVVIMSQGGRMTDKAGDAISKAIQLEPENMQGLWMAGMLASAKSDYKQALTYWYKLDPMLDNDINSQTQLREQIASAEKNLSSDSLSVIKRDVAVSSEAVAKAEITVHVSLDDSVKDKVSATDTLFIYAKAMQGPPMPLAAVKHSVGVLPVTVKLNDAMAMMPAMKLSNFDQVKISAVVSKSGQPGMNSGDLFAELGSVAVIANQKVSLVINQIKK
ncbi:MAG: c-type cytochrome biogenesis protein CcmI [Gammaproteobacteria bacterium]|nr:c-type cytochrome biogenesis protein CcmI [Gammaproteobacteria bacterium]MCW9003906.1 c-type cytochrome biogenesis protein CcmI [Gammaproteobacteria bacterium]MCW9056255.1 c-type cytochrome biogenesis protein CcmI [Gammaproteobacteria bacterium]